MVALDLGQGLSNNVHLNISLGLIENSSACD